MELYGENVAYPVTPDMRRTMISIEGRAALVRGMIMANSIQNSAVFDRPRACSLPDTSSSLRRPPTQNSLVFPSPSTIRNAPSNTERSWVGVLASLVSRLLRTVIARPLATEIPDPGILTDRTRRIAFRITSAFEGGETDSLQTADDGIISYGMHQATLRSGALQRVIDAYVESSLSPTAIALSTYANRIRSKDQTLRSDERFLTLLKSAARESSMEAAQNEIFEADYYRPAVRRAVGIGLRSPLAAAVFYDTAVQGGLGSVLNRTGAADIATPTDEQNFLRRFLLARRAYLLDVAESKLYKGDVRSSQLLMSAASGRIEELLRLVESGNLELRTPFVSFGQIIEYH